MKKYTNTYQPENDAQLDALLNKRKAPLSQEGLNKVLQDLTLFMRQSIQKKMKNYLPVPKLKKLT